MNNISIDSLPCQNLDLECANKLAKNNIAQLQKLPSVIKYLWTPQHLNEWLQHCQNEVKWLVDYEPLKNELNTYYQNGEYVELCVKASLSTLGHLWSPYYLVLKTVGIEGTLAAAKTGLHAITQVSNQLYTSVGKPLYNEIEKSCNDKNHFDHTFLMYATTTCWFLRETPQEIINEEISFNMVSAIDITKYSLGMLGEYFTTEIETQDIL